MNSEELNTFLDSMKEKLGEENSALISDDLGNLITKNTEVFNTLNNKDKEIERLKEELKYTIPIVEHNKTITKHLNEIERLNNIINEFDKWLLGEKMLFYRSSDNERLIRYGETKNKWLELKGSDKE